FLLFQVQPLIAKVILPWFGGGPAVWTACMLFFQVLLLCGYSYAHLVSSRFPPRALAAVHLALLLGSLWLLPVTPSQAWKPSGGEMPVARILGLLVFTIGLPYFLLSTTGPLLQDSFRRETGRTPYRLYALSNIGSLLALVTYPFVFEPRFTLRTQVLAWSGGYVLFVALCGWCAVAFVRVWQPAAAGAAASTPAEAAAPRPAIKTVLLWLALAACGSVMLLATTNQICQEVTAVPFLWVLPLSLYLFTFIICFDHERWYHPGVFVVLLVAAVLSACYAMWEGNSLMIWWQLAIYSATLFVCCMVCHGELVLSKPAPQYATLFYLMVAGGGAVGGILVAIVAPLVLRGFWEFHIGLVATVTLAIIASVARSKTSTNIPRGVLIGGGALALALAVSIGLVVGRSGAVTQRTLESARNFYGVLRVNLEESSHTDNGPLRELIHGSIQHGFQFLDPDKKNWPTTYYGRPSGVGLAIEHHPRRSALNPDDRALAIGVVGLGCGTLAAYGIKGDHLRFYEINPEVVRLSDKYFTYRQDTPAEVEVVLGDARIKLEQELADGRPQKFDVLVIDAFSSDSIPMHLLTRQSVDLFLKHLQPDGLLCVHISNRFLDLAGVVIGIARELGYPCVMIENDEDVSQGLNVASWVILTCNWEFLADPATSGVSAPCWPVKGEPVVWTDDYGSLFQVLSTE
ncbi:MAG: fused MFS/spermidine synthase, partial [Pirellulales bacterium]